MVVLLQWPHHATTLHVDAELLVTQQDDIRPITGQVSAITLRRSSTSLDPGWNVLTLQLYASTFEPRHINTTLIPSRDKPRWNVTHWLGAWWICTGNFRNQWHDSTIVTFRASWKWSHLHMLKAFKKVESAIYRLCNVSVSPFVYVYVRDSSVYIFVVQYIVRVYLISDNQTLAIVPL